MTFLHTSSLVIVGMLVLVLAIAFVVSGAGPRVLSAATGNWKLSKQ